MRLQAVLYRGHDPQWAFSPLSGDGAKAKGGRFNPIGVPALYLGATIDAVIIEMTHGFARRLEPLTMVSYDVDVEDIVDLSSKSSSRLRCLFRGTSQQTLIVCRHGRYWRYCGRGRLNPECRAPTRMTPS